ncbi:adenylate/guanylate cyclase domain-containing protein [Burkholderia ubonensis]|uniref:adenylate/guanylate cyclase domain-containing protein n=1 Tax=Burkholderia ubonensis TaxID=101571 RepID=UPI0009B47F9B|nr:adenylate/guanylate cyclase domain-containing protein [Burkholderia ubonensis]
MQTNNRDYILDDSDSRLREILDAPAGAYEEVDSIPDRSRLTYANGFYVNCTAIFIDIRDSSKLPTLHNTPVLGKIYRAYISECIAVLNSFEECKEIFIAGDCVSGIFNTPCKVDINTAFFAAGALNSLIQHLNWRLEQKGYSAIRCGIGISYGRALMLKSGFSGSGLSDVVWMGNVVNEASNLCHQGNKGGRLPVQVANVVYQNLTDEYKQFAYPVYTNINILGAPSQYEGDIVVVKMRDWLQAKQPASRLNALAALIQGQNAFAQGAGSGYGLNQLLQIPPPPRR